MDNQKKENKIEINPDEIPDELWIDCSKPISEETEEIFKLLKKRRKF